MVITFKILDIIIETILHKQAFFSGEEETLMLLVDGKLEDETGARQYTKGIRIVETP